MLRDIEREKISLALGEKSLPSLIHCASRLTLSNIIRPMIDETKVTLGTQC